MKTIYAGTGDFQSGKYSAVTYDGLGTPAEDIPSSGTHGPAYAYESLSIPGDNGKEIRGEITSGPSVTSGSGTISSFYAYDDTSFDLEVTDDCTVEWVWSLWIDNVLDTSGLTATITIGGQSIVCTAITEGESFGTLTIQVGAVTITTTVINESESFGSAAIGQGETIIEASSISEVETFGSATVNPGAIAIVVTSISEGESFGTATLAAGELIQPASLEEITQFGTASLTTGPIEISAVSIETLELFGNARVGDIIIIDETGLRAYFRAYTSGYTDPYQ